jgi:hypothetical protein
VWWDDRDDCVDAGTCCRRGQFDACLLLQPLPHIGEDPLQIEGFFWAGVDGGEVKVFGEWRFVKVPVLRLSWWCPVVIGPSGRFFGGV